MMCFQPFACWLGLGWAMMAGSSYLRQPETFAKPVTIAKPVTNGASAARRYLVNQ